MSVFGAAARVGVGVLVVVLDLIRTLLAIDELLQPLRVVSKLKPRFAHLLCQGRPARLVGRHWRRERVVRHRFLNFLRLHDRVRLLRLGLRNRTSFLHIWPIELQGREIAFFTLLFLLDRNFQQPLFHGVDLPLVELLMMRVNAASLV